MGIRVRALGWWLAALAVSTAAVSASDLSLVDAVKNRDGEAVRSLLKQRVEVNAPQGDGATALAWAAHWNDLETAELLIRAGARAGAANDLGVTPLWEACTNRSAAMVEKLLKAGADPNAAMGTGETPLMMCSRTGSLEAVQSLLAAGANGNAKENRKGQTALMWAVANRHPEVARVLIERGADVRARTKHVVLPAAKSGGYPAGDVYEGDFREVSKGGFTPLLFAAQQGDAESVRILLGAGADVNEATPEGSTALIRAAANGHVAAVKLLLEKGADASAADDNGMTALHYAVVKGLWVIRGITLRHYNNYLLRPHVPELVDVLVAHRANPNVQIKKGPETVWFVDGMSPAGATPLLLAAISNNAGIMKTLLDAGADPNLAMEGKITPLMMAAGMLRDQRIGSDGTALDAVKVAVEARAGVNAANELGQTALHAAAASGENAVIQYLVERGANVDAKDKYGQTAWNIAANIAPPGQAPPGQQLRRGTLPRNTNKSTADLLVKLGATPQPAPVAAGNPSK